MRIIKRKSTNFCNKIENWLKYKIIYEKLVKKVKKVKATAKHKNFVKIVIEIFIKWKIWANNNEIEILEVKFILSKNCVKTIQIYIYIYIWHFEI